MVSELRFRGRPAKFREEYDRWDLVAETTTVLGREGNHLRCHSPRLRPYPQEADWYLWQLLRRRSKYRRPYQAT